MLNCKQASLLASRAQDEELRFWNKIKLRLHLLLCRGCANFAQQLSFIRKASHNDHAHHHFHLSEKAKQQILQTLRQNSS